MAQDTKVVELLNIYHKSPVTQKLREKFLTPSIFDIIQKDRSETVHSNFLKWIFDLQVSNGIEGFNIISSLLQVAYKRALEQEKQDYFPTDLAKAAYADPSAIQLAKLDPEHDEVHREYKCPGVYYADDKKQNAGIVDLVISGTYINGKQIKPFKIIIENKVDTKEHDLQTWKYYTYFEGKRMAETPAEIEIREKLYDPVEDEVRLYLFLTPDSNPTNTDCDCGYFININYQDIMEHCIAPLLQSTQIDSRSKLFLDEYSRALSLPYINNIGTTIIMSLSQVDAALLTEFWEANKTLIKMSIDALKQTSQDDGEIQEVSNAIENLTSSRKKYTITYTSGAYKQSNQSNLMYDLMKMYIENTSKSGSDIVKLYQGLGKAVFSTDPKKTGYSKEWLTFNDGTKVRVTTQIQRNAERLEKIKELAQNDGFTIS